MRRFFLPSLSSFTPNANSATFALICGTQKRRTKKHICIVKSDKKNNNFNYSHLYWDIESSVGDVWKGNVFCFLIRIFSNLINKKTGMPSLKIETKQCVCLIFFFCVLSKFISNKIMFSIFRKFWKSYTDFCLHVIQGSFTTIDTFFVQNMTFFVSQKLNCTFLGRHWTD